uniref:Gustatory receptor n=1 Tax=Vespula pensylvanica TaxID=30213 RepID=A0A834PA25_VESPE|nr:hypothetical protein H0235_002556 [Vespula pensylvanica]
MSLSAKFRYSIKPLIIMNSIFTTGLVEYFVNDNINAIGIVYAFFSIIFYILIASTLPFSTQISFRDERPLLIRLTRQLHIYSGYVFYIINIIAGILRRKKLRRFMLQIETCVRTMDQLNIPMNSSKCFWQQCYLILFLIRDFTLQLIQNPLSFSSYGFFDLGYTLIRSMIGTVTTYLIILIQVGDLSSQVLFHNSTLSVSDLCIKSEFRRVNELLSDINVLPISSIALELLEHKEADGSLSIERSLPVDSKKIFIARPSLCQTQSRLQVASHKINRSRRLLRTIRQVHLELYKMSKSYSNMYGIQISLEMAISAERTSEIIHTFYGQNTDFEIKKEVEIFSLQMMQCRTAYTAFGLYNFNCKHICSVVYRYHNNIHGYHDTSKQFNRTRIIDHCDSLSSSE